MDFAITSFVAPAPAPPAPAGGVPAAGAGKPAARGPGQAAGTSAELAALFADLVANAGAITHDATAAPDVPSDMIPAEDTPDPADTEDPAAAGEGIPSVTWQAPVLPWQWAIEPAVNAAGSDAIDAIDTIEATVPEAHGIESVATPIEGAITPDEGLATNAGTGTTPAPPITSAVEAPVTAESATAPPAAVPHQGVSSTRASQGPSVKIEGAADTMSPAARALARTLAALNGQSRTPVADATPTTASAGATPGELPKTAAAAGARHGGTVSHLQPDAQFDPAAAAVLSSQLSAVATSALAPAAADGAAADAATTLSSVDLSTGLALPTAADPDLVVRAAVSTLMASHQQQGGRQFSLETAGLPADIAAEAQRADVPDQIVRAMRVQLKGDVGQVRLQLRPEFLGEVRIDIKVEGDRVNASMQVERSEVRQYIEANGQTLRSALSASGLHLDELTVRDQESSRRETPDHEPEQPRRQAPRRQSRQDAEREFEIPV